LSGRLAQLNVALTNALPGMQCIPPVYACPNDEKTDVSEVQQVVLFISAIETQPDISSPDIKIIIMLGSVYALITHGRSDLLSWYIFPQSYEGPFNGILIRREAA
jgi:hypothetical protein